jgi:hypothetical protein
MGLWITERPVFQTAFITRKSAMIAAWFVVIE